MRAKVKTITQRIGTIKTTQTGEFPTKTYYHAGVQGHRKIVLLDQYILADTEYYGWKTVKTFKGKYLQFDRVTIRLETFLSIAKSMNQFNTLYDKMINYENYTNDSNG